MKKNHINRILMYMRNVVAVCIVAAMILDCICVAQYNSNADKMCVVQEEHELETYMADGNFDGDESGDPIIKESDIPISVEDKYQFNILEIVPHVSMGVIGYSISGHEPVDASEVKIGDTVMASKEDMIYATMDALVNRKPGDNNANSQDINMNADAGQLSSKMREGGVYDAFTLESDHVYSGYYKYIGANRGVYAIATKEDGTYEVDKTNKNAIMVSKFYPTEKTNTGDFGYIWVYSDDVSDKVTPDDYKFIYVENHKRIKYINNDKFLLEMYGLAESNLNAWKNSHKISLVTRAPKDVSMSDIEAADIIFVNSGQNMDYYNNAVNLYNRMHGTNYNKGSLNFSTDNDFKGEGSFTGFEKTIRIYERVVIREDVAFIGSKNCLNGHTFDTNLRKLMCMLFFVNNKDISNQTGSGREMFMDYMKRYVDEPGNNFTYDPDDGTIKSYYDLRSNGGGGYDIWSKYIAPSLRGKSSGYMHQTHPLVRTNDDAVAYSYYDSNTHNLVSVRGAANQKNRRSAKRNDKDMYYADGDRLGLDENASHDAKVNYGEKVKEFYYSPYGYYNEKGEYIRFGVTDIIPNSASDRERQEMTEFKDEYAPYRWRMPLYESKSSTTDYAYIDNNGNFVRDTKYSGEWYGIDALTNNGQVWEYKVVKWNPMNQSQWPWDVVEGSCLRNWWFAEGSTQVPGNSKGKHIHLYYDYFAYGPYRAVNDAVAGTYKNQSLEEENALFKGSLIEDAIEGREVEREYEENHMVEADETDSFYYRISMNIVNGDGCNKSLSGKKNKILYVNQYEKNNTPFIPITFEVETSLDIESITLRKEGAATSIVKFTPKSGNDITQNGPLKFNGGATGLTLNKLENKDKDGNQIYTGPESSAAKKPVYKYKGTIAKDLVSSYYDTGVNNTFVLEVEVIEPAEATVEIDPVADEITVVIRDFFNLN